jgi:hypothetical protein
LSPLKFSRNDVEKLVQNHQLISCLSTVKTLLNKLGIYDGETPHSFRAGCAITIALTDAVENVEGVMNHIGNR